MLHDLMIDAIIVIAGFFLAEQWSARPIEFKSPLSERLRFGFIGGIIGIIMMNSTVRIDEIVVTFHHIPALIAGVYGGPIAIVAAGAVITISRFLLYGVTEAAVAPGIFMVVLTLILVVVCRYVRTPWRRWAYGMSLSTGTLAVGMYAKLAQEGNTSGMLELFVFLTGNVIISAIACYIVSYIQHRKEMYVQLQKQNEALQRQHELLEKANVSILKQQSVIEQSHSEISNVLESITDAFYTLDREWRFTYVNRAAAADLRRFDEKVIGKNIRDVLPHLVTSKAHEVYKKAMYERTMGQFEMYSQTVDRYFHLRVYPSADGISVYYQDITERKRAEAALNQTLSELKDLKHALDASSIVVILDQEEIITYVNERMCEISKYNRTELIGQTYEFMFPNHHLQSFFANIEAAMKAGAAWSGELCSQAKDGCTYWTDTTVVPFLNAVGKPYQYVIISNDITARKEAEQQLVEANKMLKQLSSLDGLTGIGNRRYFDEVFNHEWERAFQTNRPLTVVLWDVDHFKLYNDHYGHQQGDECLRKIAEAMNLSLQRTNDFCARYGGEEFVVVLPNTDAEGGRKAAERIREQIAALKIPHERSDVQPYVTASFGVASITPNIHERKELIANADQALYKAKRAGRNCAAVFGMEAAPLKAEPVPNTTYQGLQQYIDMLHLKDTATWEHSNRVAHYVLLLAQQFNMPQSDRETLFMAALLHDIGKLDIPESILKKPDRLTSQEFAIIKQHSQLGFEKLTRHGSEWASQEILDVVLYHHERWDGLGYPMGLTGTNIPYVARLLAVADAFAAMTEDRVYQKGMTIDAAIDEIKRGKGKQFDPELAEAFITVFTREGYVV